jgi:deazaflavin-dependent oxidoreductase (nitroreductase family)
MSDFTTRIIEEFRANEGRVGAPFQGATLLLLHTTGARSGEERVSPVAYLRVGEELAIFGSKAGAPTNPAWYHNLRTHPIVTVEVHGEKFKARAKVVDGEDYERLFQQHAKKMPGFNDYRQKTTRKLPVIVLERLDSEDAA